MVNFSLCTCFAQTRIIWEGDKDGSLKHHQRKSQLNNKSKKTILPQINLQSLYTEIYIYCCGSSVKFHHI